MINNRLLRYKFKHNFVRDLDANLIKNDAIVFIEYPRLIWTHGKEYYCDTETIGRMTEEEIINMIDSYSGSGDPFSGGSTFTIPDNSVSTNTIINNTIKIEDLSEEVQELLAQDITEEEAAAIWQEALNKARRSENN